MLSMQKSFLELMLARECWYPELSWHLQTQTCPLYFAAVSFLYGSHGQYNQQGARSNICHGRNSPCTARLHSWTAICSILLCQIFFWHPCRYYTYTTSGKTWRYVDNHQHCVSQYALEDCSSSVTHEYLQSFTVLWIVLTHQNNGHCIPSESFNCLLSRIIWNRLQFFTWKTSGAETTNNYWEFQLYTSNCGL